MIKKLLIIMAAVLIGGGTALWYTSGGYTIFAQTAMPTEIPANTPIPDQNPSISPTPEATPNPNPTLMPPISVTPNPGPVPAVTQQSQGGESDTNLSSSSATIVFDTVENEFEPENPIIAENGTVIFNNDSTSDITLVSTDKQVYQPLNVTVPAGSSVTVNFGPNMGTYHYSSSTNTAIKGAITVED
jgi:plastocyanin